MTMEYKTHPAISKTKHSRFNFHSTQIVEKIKGIFDSNYFFDAAAPVFALALGFGAMPLFGVCSRDPYKLEFRWKSFRFAYSLALIISQILFAITIINSSIKNGLTISKVSEYILLPTFTYEALSCKIIPFSALYVVYISVIYIMIMMIFIARKWPATMRHWRKVELNLPPILGEKRSNGMGQRIRKVAPLVICMSLTEHILGIIATVISIIKCPIDPNDNAKSFFTEHLPVFFDATSYAPWKAVLAKFANLVNTFMWFYVDLFIMIVALGLSSVFRQYCDFLVKFSGKRMTKHFWNEQRAAYRQICELIDYVDRVISPITIVSFSNNLYFICLQLMNTLKYVHI